MTKKKEYTIIVRRKRVIVTYDVYKAYHAEREHARYITNEARKHEISQEWLEDHGVNPKYIEAEAVLSPLDIIIRQEQLAKLRVALRSLPEGDQRLIHALFFERKGERKVASETENPRMTINSRKHKILNQLRKLIEK